MHNGDEHKPIYRQIFRIIEPSLSSSKIPNILMWYLLIVSSLITLPITKQFLNSVTRKCCILQSRNACFNALLKKTHWVDLVTILYIYIIPKRIIFSYNYNIPICILISMPDYGTFFDISSFFSLSTICKNYWVKERRITLKRILTDVLRALILSRIMCTTITNS